MLACMLLVVAALFSIDFIRSVRYCKQRGAETMQFLEEDKEAVYVMDGHSAKHLHDIRVVAYMSQKYCLVDGWVPDSIDAKIPNLGVFNNLHEMASCNDLKALMSEGKHVYLLCDEDIESEKIVQEGRFAYEDMGLYKMGLFSANIYRLSCTEAAQQP